MNLGLVILAYIGATLITLPLGLFVKWFDRKVTARIQYRKGPPWFQPIADVLKLLHKETLVPSTGRRTGFLIAPAIALAAALLTAAMLWVPLLTARGSFVGDLIVVIYLLLIPPLATILGASASGSPHAAVGASREMKLILAYELPFILVLLVGVIHSDWKIQLGEMAAAQQAGGATLCSISGAIGIIVAILVVQAKLGLVPFDAAEAECEIMSGVFVEYSGVPLAMIYVTRAVMLAIMPLLLILVFWGGMGASGLGILAFIGKYVVLLVLVTLIRNTNPRLRIDQAVKFFWLGLAPLAALAVLLALLGKYKALTWL